MQDQVTLLNWNKLILNGIVWFKLLILFSIRQMNIFQPNMEQIYHNKTNVGKINLLRFNIQETLSSLVYGKLALLA